MKNLLVFVALISSIVTLIQCSDEPNLPQLSTLEIKSSDGNEVVEGESIQLEVSGFDESGLAFALVSNVIWTSSDQNVAKVSQSGLVEAIELGSTIITAETLGISTSFEVSVQPRVLTFLFLNSARGAKLDIGEQSQINIVGYDQTNKIMPISSTITWSSDNDNAVVSPLGVVTGVSVGSAQIEAEVEGISKTILLNIWDSSAPRIEIYVSDVGQDRSGPYQILKYDEDGQNGEVFINSNLSKPQDIVFLEDQGVVLVSNLTTRNITKYDASTGDYLGVFASGLNEPTRVEIGPDDLIYVIQWKGGPVVRYDQTGNFIDNFSSSNINQAIGIAWDESRNMYVSSFNTGSNGFVKKFNAEGEDQGVFINNNLAGPTDIWFDGEGNLMVSDWAGNVVKKFNDQGLYLSDFITGIEQPEGVDFLNGKILLGNSGLGSVMMFSASGSLIETLVSPGSSGLKTTNAVTVRRINFR